MKRIIALLSGILLLLGALVGVALNAPEKDKGVVVGNVDGEVSVIRSHFATSTYANKSTGNQYVTSTTSWNMIPGEVAIVYEGDTPEGMYATTTMEIPVNGASVVTVGLFMVSSTSASQISMDVKVSADGTAWFDYFPQLHTNGSNAGFFDARQIGTSTFATWIPGVDAGKGTSTPSFSLDLNGLAAKAVRLSFGASRATSTLNATVMLK